MGETLVYERMHALGYTITPAQWQRVGFRLCLVLAAEGVRRDQAYLVSSIAVFPEDCSAWIEQLIKETLCDIL